MISMDGRIDMHHHATDNNPLYELPGPWIWWSEAEALKMDKNDVAVPMLSHTGRLPQSPQTIKAMMAIRDSPLGRTKPVRAAMHKAAQNTNLAAAEIASHHPDRFGFFATIMPLDPDDAIAEASFAFDELGAEVKFFARQLDEFQLDSVMHQAISWTNAAALFPRLRHHWPEAASVDPPRGGE